MQPAELDCRTREQIMDHLYREWLAAELKKAEIVFDLYQGI